MSVTSSTIIDPSMSLHQPKKSSEISKTYKEATALYLTRRLPEALATIQPLVSETHSNQDSDNDEASNVEAAPIASASRKIRIKVWCLYLTLLNSIASLGPGEGKETFGAKEWKNLVTKAQEGSIWQDVVRTGYGGIESNVDIEVVTNLANLLLAQSPSQKTNQEHIEYFLSSNAAPSLEIGPHASINGGDGLKGLESRIALIEVFALHVLPRNQEWDYAKDFLKQSDILDEDTRDAFLQTLKGLEEEELGTNSLQQLEPRQESDPSQELQMQDSFSTDSASTIREAPINSHRRINSEIDYGIEENTPPKLIQKEAVPTVRPLRRMSSNNNGVKTRRADSNVFPRRPVNTGNHRGSLRVLGALQHIISHISQYISQNPLALLRFVVFLVSLVAALSRRDVKDRLKVGWDKLKRTVGMGVKVTYI